MEEFSIGKITKIITENILTPIIFMLENEDNVEFICFYDRSLTDETIFETQEALGFYLGKMAEIVDIREYCVTDRIDLMHDAELIYSEDPMMEQIFMMSMFEDLQSAMYDRYGMLMRYRETGSHYLQ